MELDQTQKDLNLSDRYLRFLSQELMVKVLFFNIVLPTSYRSKSYKKMVFLVGYLNVQFLEILNHQPIYSDFQS